MADNETTLRDEDGDYSDWIELRNTTGATIGLGGMYLTNDTNDVRSYCISDHTPIDWNNVTVT